MAEIHLSNDRKLVQFLFGLDDGLQDLTAHSGSPLKPADDQPFDSAEAGLLYE
ncbi:hypothetical protein D3C75_1305220 [compost metagenome]